ncbi:DUF4350 domain-containing protein [Streptomyces pinistramenti]|uniref:DUF4350 domain-containing protein n=1 Tax=Streptomyces pinistramenti TaxID=2884812 RepID=UPI001D05EF07|nr:DUF4350 domain-containing protein [Streptomyces pinistramenti]MCB5912047.1 DUF4350 domain-containing protein [Streptomyces pinistramenti]
MSAPTSSTSSLAPSGRRIWLRSRGLLYALLLLVICGVVLAALQSGQQHGRLDPRSADPLGSRALATLLADHGVTTKVVTTAEEAAAAAGPGTTLLVSDPDILTRRQLTGLRTATAHTAGRTVLLAPGTTALKPFVPQVTAEPPITVEPRPPGCSLPDARRAGDALMGGVRYAAPPDTAADRCYSGNGLPTLLHLSAPDAGRDVLLLGSPEFLYNHRLAERGNASLALQLLGAHHHLVWYLPSLSDPASARNEQRGFLDLIPSGWSWGLLQLACAAGFAALWRARRLGPLVPERLPVTVPAAETTEGHARLYQQANARDRASAVLRSATRTRLAPLIGVPPAHAHTPDILLPAVHSHLPQATDTPAELSALLFGPAPADDKALVHLADQLDDLTTSIVSQERHAPREHPDR